MKIISEPIKTKRLSEIIEAHIRQLILDGNIKPGQRLPTEKEISQQFGVSVITVREGLKVLEASELIERRTGKGGGVFSRTPGRETVKTSLYNFLSLEKITSENLTELRLILEPMTARIAVGRITNGEIKNLEKNVQYCTEKLDPKFIDVRKQKNIEFHVLIAEATKNPVLVLMIEYFMEFLFEWKVKAFDPTPDWSLAVTNDHRNIVKALKARDGEMAEREMIMHLERLNRYFAENNRLK